MQTNEREIVVKGVGQMSVTPDLIELQMRLETSDLDYDKSIQLGSEAIDKLRTAIVAAGHDKKALKTTQYNINAENHRYRDKDIWKEEFMGYLCTQSVKLRFDYDMEILSRTIGEITKNDATPNIRLHFTVKEPHAVKEALLEKAIENAKLTAGILANSAGVSLGEIKRIDYNWSEAFFYSNTDMKVSALITAGDSNDYSYPNMDFEPDDINTSDTAMIVWEII